MKPNFFLIGAPKCGTTSVATWLADHPQVFFSRHKEPHHFNTDHKWVITPKRQDYERLFEEATHQHLAVGEGSVWYLHSQRAVPSIEQYSTNPKYIVCVRNPVEMAYSLHEQQIVSGNEHIVDFAEAWFRSSARLRGEMVSAWCREPVHLSYGHVCLLGTQLERLFSQVPRERVHVIMLEDIRREPRSEYRKLLDFLGVRDDGRTEFPVVNAAKARRSMAVRRIVQLLGGLKRGLGMTRGLGVLNAIDKTNVRYRERPTMTPDIRAQLQEYFREDITLLARLLNMDLSHWLVGK